jgi:hypothetical protein
MKNVGKWPIFKWVGYGFLVGAAIGLFNNHEMLAMGGRALASGLGAVIGTGLAGAVIAAAVCGIRNMRSG